MEAPPESLPQPVLVRRQDLLNRFPAYAQLSQRAKQLKADVSALPAVPADQEQQNKLAALQSQLAEVGAAQEAILPPLALGRESCDFVFPPATDVDVVKQQLAPGQRILAFVSTRQATYAFMLGADNYASWQLEAPAKIKTNVQKLLRDMGQYDRNQPIGIKELANTSWRDVAAEVLKQLTANASADAWTPIEELIIVPDGLLWYVPFETLQIDNGTEKISLIDKVRIRYVPTIACAVPDKRPRRASVRP